MSRTYKRSQAKPKLAASFYTAAGSRQQQEQHISRVSTIQVYCKSQRWARNSKTTPAASGPALVALLAAGATLLAHAAISAAASSTSSTRVAHLHNYLNNYDQQSAKTQVDNGLVSQNGTGNTPSGCPTNGVNGQRSETSELPLGSSSPNGGASGQPNAAAGQQATDELQSFGYTEARVSSFVKPSFYTLRLKVDPAKRRFSGQLMITLEVAAPNEQAASGRAEGAPATEQPASGGEARDAHKSPAELGYDSQNGQLGYRYLTLHAGANLQFRKAIYVFSSRGNLQISAARIGRNPGSELLTIDFEPNVITAGQGLLLFVYSGSVNQTDSLGLFAHHSQKARRQPPAQQSSGAAGTTAGSQMISLQEDSGLATHMQPNFARRLFPAWDEPHLKARFNVIVVLPFRGYQTISNTPVKRKSISLSCSGEPLQEVEFHTTPTMSTYLLTLIVDRFDYVESITPNNCKVRAYVYAPAQKWKPAPSVLEAADSRAPEPTAVAVREQQNYRLAAAQPALEVAVRVFDYFETRLGVKYPLAKFDMIALREFDNGGMENWGAAIFHESYLLYDPAASGAGQAIQVNGARSRPKRMVVPLIVAHEIAHQWFGNLITARSWTYLWLNEGFAQFLSYDASERLLAGENYWHLFTEDGRSSAMREDELVTSARALEFELPEREEEGNSSWSSSGATAPGTLGAARQREQPKAGAYPSATDQLSLFDQLTYNKGAMVVRMVFQLLGREQFFAGLQHYLLKHAYDSVSSHHLWLALEESTGRAEGELESLMAPWLRQEGYPLLSVLVSENSSHFKVRLSQERFTLLQLEPNAAQAWQDWSWPLAVAVSCELAPSPSETQLVARDWPAQATPAAPDTTSAAPFGAQSRAILVRERQQMLALAKSTLGAWFKLNFNASGYYRVDYQLKLNSDGSAVANQPPTGTVDVLGRLASAVRSRSLGALDRFNLADDLFALVQAGKKPVAYYLRYLSAAYEHENEPLVLRAIVESLKRIRAAIVTNSGAPELGPLYERYVQRYLRRLAQRQTKTATAANSNEQQQLKEIEDLMNAARLHFNEPEAVERASDLFARNYRQPTLDNLDRATRASIYSGALMCAEATSADLAPTDELPLGSGGAAAAAAAAPQQQQQLQPTSTAGSGADVTPGEPSSILAPGTRPSNGNGNLQSAANSSSSLFLRLLRAYESSESASERYAICSALGSVSKPNKRLKLLELLLRGAYFRSQDAAPLFEAMARSGAGRQLIWAAVRSNPQGLEQRQLLAPAIRSLASGLLEPGPSGSKSLENHLRTLYLEFGAQHGKLIGQTIEFVRINTQWFARDHDGLLQFLAAADAVTSGT